MAAAPAIEPVAERIDTVPGDASTLAIPAHPDALRTAGPAFLTAAFYSFGAIATDNRVTEIVRIEPCRGGSTGTKLFLTVAYARADAGLNAELFVKFSRNFDDALRDRQKHEMESEVRFAALSREPGFPIEVPRAYFADYHHASGTGLLITEVIGFGRGDIEPQHIKCMDHLLDDPLAYYRTIIDALAQIAAAHKSGALMSAIERLFPYDHAAAVAGDPIRWSEAELDGWLDRFAAFAAACPQLMPEAIRSPAFWSRLRADAPRFLKHEAAIKRFLQQDPVLIALCHWNGNIDNAWFHRDPGGALHCGLMDWGRVGQINLAFALWGCLSAAPHAMVEQHFDALLSRFVAAVAQHGGPVLDIDRLRLCFDMYVATMGLAWLVEAPMRILHYLPDAAQMTGPLDPRLLAIDPARGQLHASTQFLALWQRHDFAAGLDRVLDDAAGRNRLVQV